MNTSQPEASTEYSTSLRGSERRRGRCEGSSGDAKRTNGLHLETLVAVAPMVAGVLVAARSA